MDLCEIRIPTYKRPTLLKRAIESVINQDHRHWKAVVMDDSPEQEAKAVVEAFSDSRLIYYLNSRNLGSAGNIDQAFSTRSLLKGCYACVLEDDNWLKPTYLSANIAALEASGVDLLLRNQEIWLQTENQARPTGKTTRGDWFADRVYSPRELHAHLFFFEAASNGGLFWRTTMQSQLQVGRDVTDAGLQEYCRALQIANSFKFESTPLSYWADMPSSLSLRNPSDNRTFARGIQSIRRHLLTQYGNDFLHDVSTIAIALQKTAEFEAALADVSQLHSSVSVGKAIRNTKQYLKSYLRRLFTENPLAAYLSA